MSGLIACRPAATSTVSAGPVAAPETGAATAVTPASAATATTTDDPRRGNLTAPPEQSGQDPPGKCTHGQHRERDRPTNQRQEVTPRGHVGDAGSERGPQPLGDVDERVDEHEDLQP